MIVGHEDPQDGHRDSPPASGGCDGRAATLAWSIGWKLYLYQELTLGSCASQKHTCLTYLAGLESVMRNEHGSLQTTNVQCRTLAHPSRSEERRVGKECRSRSAEHRTGKREMNGMS